MPPAALVAPLRVAESIIEPPAIMLDAERLVVMVGLSCVTNRVMIAHRVSIPFVPVTFNEY